MTTSLMWISRPPAQALMPTQQQRKGIRSMNSKAVLLGHQAMILGNSEEQQRQQEILQRQLLEMSNNQRICQNVYREQACLSNILPPQSIAEVQAYKGGTH